MKKNSTKNQLIPTPMRMPKMRASWKFVRGAINSMVWPKTAHPGGERARGGPARAQRERRPSHIVRARARDDRLEVGAGGQRDVLEAAFISEARGAERVGHRRRPVAHEQRALQAQRHVL